MKNTSNSTHPKETLKRNWLKENAPLICIITLVILALYVIGKILSSILIIASTTILAFLAYLYMRNKMMSFIEKELYMKNKEP